MNNYLNHTEAKRLEQLQQERMTGQCDSACETEIKGLETLDRQRNQQLAACEGQNTPQCTKAVADVRQAAAEYVRANAMDQGLTVVYATEHNETIQLAKSTLGDYTVWNVVKGAADSTVEGIKGLAGAAYTGFKAVTGDEQASAQAKAGLGAAWDFVSEPDNWPQLLGAMSPEQREQLAVAYETGNGKAVASTLGEVLSNLPVGGGAGTIKKVTTLADMAEDAARLGQLVQRADVDRVVQVPAGSKGNWDPTINTGKGGSLTPNTAYLLDNGHAYITDASGRVKEVTGELNSTTMDRNPYQQLCSGQSGCTGDDGGHLIASSLGGAGDSVNMVPQASTLNRGDWKAMENFLRGEIGAGKNVTVKIEVGYPAGGWCST